MFRQRINGVWLAQDFMHKLVNDGQARFKGDAADMRVRLKGECMADMEGRRGKVMMRGDVRIDQTTRDRTRTYRARKADLFIQPSQDAMMISLVLRDNVKLRDRSESPEEVTQASPCDVPPVTIPLAMVPTKEHYTDEQILNRTITLQMPQPLQEEQANLTNKVGDLRREITAAIHARLAMSASTIVLVLLAAALGILLRGGHALTAFGVAFIPTVIVVLMITTGRTLAEQAHTSVLGLLLMWGILVVVAILDGVVIFGGIRR